MRYFNTKKNSPTLAFETVYGKEDTPFLTGRTMAPKKIWNGIDIDANLKTSWIEELNRLPVEIKSTEEGKGSERPAFVVFRMPEGKDDKANKMVAKLKLQGLRFVTSDIGMQGRPRICVAEPIKPGDPGWEAWWSSLPKKIKNAYDLI